MKKLLLFLIFAVTVALVAAFGAPVYARMGSPVEKEIHIKKGATCWSYQGNATSFYGTFGGDQYVEVRAFAEVGGNLQDAKITAYGLRGNRRVEVTPNGDQQPPSFTPKWEGNSGPLQITFALDFNTESECCGPQKINVVYFHVCANVPE